MRQSPTLMLKRPLGRPAPGALVDRILPPPRRSIVDELVSASETAPAAGGGRVWQSAPPRPPPAQPPPKETAPPPPPEWPAWKVRQAMKRGQLPPQLPRWYHMVEAVELLGEAAKPGITLRATRRQRLEDLVGQYPPTPEVAARWKACLKQLRDAKP